MGVGLTGVYWLPLSLLERDMGAGGLPSRTALTIHPSLVDAVAICRGMSVHEL